MRYGCMMATVGGRTVSGAGKRGSSALPPVVVFENGISETALAEAVTRIQHMFLSPMLVHARVRDHHRVPAIGRTYNPCEVIEPGPIPSVLRLCIADAVTLGRIRTIVNDAAIAVPHAVV